MDYNILSQDYDLTRDINIDTLKRILSKTDFNPDTKILDFGCGTGNYTCAVKKLTNAIVYGIEPSDGMREKAIAKKMDIIFLKGDHTKIPVDDNSIDLLYMTDVIHHVPDLHSMFNEFFRVLKSNGFICILTESHTQIESRFWSAYFPSTVTAEQNRYPDIDTIINVATECGLILDEINVTDYPNQIQITPDFVNLVEHKGYSMFRLISDTDFDNGLSALKRDFEKNVIINTNHGESFIWLKKHKRHLT
jgi:Methylase involved in ubiquinone/menaquinone biosynthesis